MMATVTTTLIARPGLSEGHYFACTEPEHTYTLAAGMVVRVARGERKIQERRGVVERDFSSVGVGGRGWAHVLARMGRLGIFAAAVKVHVPVPQWKTDEWHLAASGWKEDGDGAAEAESGHSEAGDREPWPGSLEP